MLYRTFLALCDMVEKVGKGLRDSTVSKVFACSQPDSILAPPIVSRKPPGGISSKSHAMSQSYAQSVVASKATRYGGKTILFVMMVSLKITL